MDITHDHHMTPSHHNYLPVNYIPNLEPQITKYTILQPSLINMGASGTAMAERQVSKSTAVAMAHCNPSVNSVSASYSLNVMVNTTPTSNTGVVSPLIQYPGLDHQLAGLQKAAFEYGSGFNLEDGFGFEDNPQIVEDHHQLDYGYEGGAGMVQARVDRLHEEVKSEAGRKSGVLLGGLGNGGVDKDSRVAANPIRISKTLKQEPSIVTHYGGSAPGTDEATSEMRTHNPALAPPSSSFLHSLVDIESVKDSELGILGQRVDMDTFDHPPDTVASTISSANGDYNGFDISFFSSLFSAASDMANSCINGTGEEQLYGIINPKSSNNNNNNRSSNMTSGSSATHAPPTSLTRCKTQSSTTKRRKSQQKRVVYVPATGGPDRPTGECIPSDTWAWRKYGQKPIKGSPHPRSYYKCSSVKGCTARKQVERNPADPLIIVVTYTADHSHPASSSSVAEQQHPVLATKSDENELDEDEEERRTQGGSDEIKQDITNNTLQQAIDDTTMNDDMVSEGSCDRLSSEGHDENMTMPDTNVPCSTDRKLHHHGADKSSNVGVAKAQKVSDIFQSSFPIKAEDDLFSQLDELPDFLGKNPILWGSQDQNPSHDSFDPAFYNWS